MLMSQNTCGLICCARNACSIVKQTVKCTLWEAYLARPSLAAFQKLAWAVSAIMISGCVIFFVAFMYAMLVSTAAMLLSLPPLVIVPHTCERENVGS